MGNDERRQDPARDPAVAATDLADADERSVVQVADPVLVAVNREAPECRAVGAKEGDRDLAAAEILVISSAGFRGQLEEDRGGSTRGS